MDLMQIGDVRRRTASFPGRIPDVIKVGDSITITGMGSKVEHSTVLSISDDRRTMTISNPKRKVGRMNTLKALIPTLVALLIAAAIVYMLHPWRF